MTAPLIAIVDDNGAIRTALSSLVRSAGYRARVHVGGADFLLDQDSERADLVVSDVHMPVCSGLELQRQIRMRWPRLPVILMTAFPDPTLRAKALDGGAVAYLTKPFDAADLLARIAAETPLGD